MVTMGTMVTMVTMMTIMDMVTMITMVTMVTMVTIIVTLITCSVHSCYPHITIFFHYPVNNVPINLREHKPWDNITVPIAAAGGGGIAECVHNVTIHFTEQEPWN